MVNNSSVQTPALAANAAEDETGSTPVLFAELLLDTWTGVAMPLLGAHQSIAGGYYKAVEAAAELKMDCVQILRRTTTSGGRCRLPKTTWRCFATRWSGRGFGAPAPTTAT
jgi:hypothetical protein